MSSKIKQTTSFRLLNFVLIVLLSSCVARTKVATNTNQVTKSKEKTVGGTVQEIQLGKDG